MIRHHKALSIEPIRVDEGFTVVEHNFPGVEGNVAEVNLSRRYPISGYARNNQSDMTVYVLEGAVRLFMGDETIYLGPGDVAAIPKRTKYYWVANPSVRMLAFSTPRWTPDQHETVDD